MHNKISLPGYYEQGARLKFLQHLIHDFEPPSIHKMKSYVIVAGQTCIIGRITISLAVSRGSESDVASIAHQWTGSACYCLVRLGHVGELMDTVEHEHDEVKHYRPHQRHGVPHCGHQAECASILTPTMPIWCRTREMINQ